MTGVFESGPPNEQTARACAEQRAREEARRDPALQEAVAAINAQAGEAAAATQRQHERELVVFELESKNKDLKLGLISLLGLFALLGTVASMAVYGELRGQERAMSSLRRGLGDMRGRVADVERENKTATAKAEQLQREIVDERAKTAAALARAQAAEDAAKTKATTGPTKRNSFSGKRWAAPAVPSFPVKTGCHPQDPLCGDLGV